MKTWEEMAPRERDAAIAKQVMGWAQVDDKDGEEGWGVPPGSEGVSWVGSPFQNYPHYTTDHAAARLVEDEIERRGLRNEYVRALIAPGAEEVTSYLWYVGHDDLWALIRATPEQRCRAAWQVMTEPSYDQ